MKHVKPPALEPSGRSRLGGAAMVIYATLILLAVTIPQGLVHWLGDMNANPPVEGLLRAATALQSASDAAGLSAPYRRARDVFIALSGAEGD